MAGTIVNNMTELNGADATTGWTNSDGPNLYTAFEREETGCLGMQGSASAENGYVAPTGSPRSMTTETIHAWIWLHGAPDTYANGGFSIVVGDGTNRAAFPCGGSNVKGWHGDPQGWQCYILSVPDKVDGEAINLAGTTASINDGSITQVGVYIDTTTAALGKVDNMFYDILWAYDHSGYAVEITAGTLGSPATFADLATWDASTATGRAIGVLSDLGGEVYLCTAPIQIGDDGTGSSYFSADTEEIIFADVDHLNNHKIRVFGNSTGTNEAYFTSVTFRNAHATLAVTMNTDGGNIDNCEFDGCIFIGITPTFSDNADSTGHSVTNSTFDGCGLIDAGDGTFTNNVITGSDQVTHRGGDMSGTSIANTTVAANDSALLYDENADPDGEMDDMFFTKGSTDTHAIEFGTNVPATMTLRACTFSGGYNQTTDDTNNAHFHFKDTGGTITLNLIDCDSSGAGGAGFTYRSDGATINLVVSPVTTLINLKNPDGDDESGVSVWLRAKDGTDELPFEQAITSISQAVGAPYTRTVTFTAAHGLKTGDYLSLSGITNATEDNSGAFQVTVTSTTVCTYTGDDTGETSFTGTIIGTGGVLYGTTDANGNISSSRSWAGDQLVFGYARKSTTSPRYKSITLDDTILSASGLTINRRLVLDE